MWFVRNPEITKNSGGINGSSEKIPSTNGFTLLIDQKTAWHEVIQSKWNPKKWFIHHSDSLCFFRSFHSFHLGGEGGFWCSLTPEKALATLRKAGSTNLINYAERNHNRLIPANSFSHLRRNILDFQKFSSGLVAFIDRHIACFIICATGKYHQPIREMAEYWNPIQVRLMLLSLLFFGSRPDLFSLL